MVQTKKKWFLWAVTAAKVAENHVDDSGLTWFLRWGIYTSIATWIHSKNSLAAEALSSKISSHGWSCQMITKTIPISMRIVISYVMEWGSLFWDYWKVNGNWDSNTVRIPNERKAIVEQIQVLEERKKFERAELWESQSGIRLWKLTKIKSKIIWDWKIMTEL